MQNVSDIKSQSLWMSRENGLSLTWSENARDVVYDEPGHGKNKLSLNVT